MVKKNTTATVRKKVAPDGDSTSPRSTRIPRDPTPSSPSFATPGENHRLHLEAVQTTALTGAATTNVHGIVAWLMNQPDCRIVSLYQHVGALCSPFHQERLVYYAFLDPHGRPTSTVHEVADAVARSVWQQERAEIRARVERVQKEIAKAVELGQVPETGGPGQPPFPPSVGGVSVSPVGVPEREVWIDESGQEWDLPEPVEGDDDTG
jgi:hypothetical protein